MIEAGQPAPDFTLADQDGKPVTLSELQGLPGGALFLSQGRHARLHQGGLRLPRRLRRLRRARVRRSSASAPTSPASHAQFAEKFDLPFTLLADPENQVCEAYGVWKEKNMYGKKSMGVERTTFVIDARGDRPRGLSPGEGRRPQRRAVLEALDDAAE